MEVVGVVPVLNVSDIRASVAWFRELGWATAFEWIDEGDDEPSFAGVTSGHAEIYLCLNAQGSPGTWQFWSVDGAGSVDALHARAVELGLDVIRAPANEPWGMREFHLRHPDGHTFRVAAPVRV